MQNCINYNCDTLGDHELSASCRGITKGGSSNWVILDCDATTTNPSSAAQINADIQAGRAKIITNVKSGFAKPSAVTVPSTTSCGVPAVVNYDRSLTIQDANISSKNIDFWNALIAGREIGGIIMLECSDEGEPQFVTWINAAVRFQGGRVLPTENIQAQIFDMEGKWRSLKDAQRYAAPVGVTDGVNTFN